MHLTETVAAPVGTLRLKVFRHGRLIESWEARNLIVNGSKALLASLLGGAVAGKSITKIGFGTNGTAPAAANTALTGAFVKAVDAPTYAAGAVTFPFTLASGEANGVSIIEFGLLSADNTLFSRRVRATPIVKAADISFIGSWTIQF